MKNRYEGACVVCGANVAAGNGFVFGPPWVTKCALCAGKLDSMKIEVARDNVGGGSNVFFKIHGFLGSRFGEFRDACAGAKYDPIRKVNIAGFDKALVIVERLRKAGFVVDMTPDVSASLQAQASIFKVSLEAADERLDEADLALRARGLSLFPFQRTGVRWLTNRWSGLLADQPGLGKTIQALLAIPKDVGVIVVSPAVAKGVWKREVAKWRPDMKVTVLSGHGSFRWPEPNEMIVLNYDILPSFEPITPKPFKQPFPMLFRNQTAQVTEPFALGIETSFQFEAQPREGQRFFASLEVSSKKSGNEWVSVCTWDETTTPEQARVILNEVYEKTYNALDLPGGSSLGGGSVKVRAKYARIVWSTSEGGGRFGVQVDRKMAPPPPPPSPIAPKGVVLIADEAHALKNSKTQRTTRWRALADIVRKKKGKTWLLTATPLLNRPVELWAILQAGDMAREAFGNWDNFCAAFNAYQGQYAYEWGDPIEALVSAALRKVSLRRMRAEVLSQLPVKTYRTITVSIDPRTASICDKAMAAIHEELPTAWDRLLAEDPTEPGVSTTLTPEDVEEARRRILNMRGRRFEEMSEARTLLARAKLPALLEMVLDFEEQEEPVVVFAAHLDALNLLGQREGWAKITGETKAEERTRIEDDFQAGKLKGIAASIKAGGVAITLTKACHAIFLELEWTPALNEQAEDRVCRIGQSRGVVITYLFADHPLDTHVTNVLALKQKIVKHSVDASRVMADEDVPYLLPEVDFDKLAQEADEEARKADEAKKLAEERVERFRIEREKAISEKRMLPVDMRPEPAPEEPVRRGPNGEREVWAMQSVMTLAGLDPDRAAVRNDVGFNASDGGVGHRLARESLFGLTDKQWELAVALCAKYWRQIGRAPAGASK